MYAAITAAERRHDVILMEKTDSLGGILKFTDTDIYKDDMRKYKNSLINRINKLSVDIMLNTEVTPELVLQENPDTLIVATGSRPLIPDIPGIDGINVVHALDVYREHEKTKERIAIIGGGLAGCETGLHLAALGNLVTVVEMTDKLASDATESYRIAVFGMMDNVIESLTDSKCTGIIPSGITVTGKNGIERFIEADTIVYATGMIANQENAIRLCDAASKQYFIIGDCAAPGKVKKAVHEGFHAAMDIY
jgi:NADPH-dependent 2,4-dienoyl-CoA reductase/sulfur reductase-like enzyme